MSDQEIDSLRALILSDRRKRRGPFSQDVRERVQGYLKKKWRSGVSLKHLGEQLGLNDHTVQFWRSHWGERDESEAKLRRVQVVSEKVETGSEVTMHGPAGTRIDGLTLDAVATLWRKLS